MPIDPSIPLAIKPVNISGQMDSAALYQGQQQKNALMGLEVQKGQQEMQGMNALKSVFSDPSSLDPTTGYPTQNALMKIYAADPKVGQQVSAHMQAAQLHDAQMKSAQALTDFRRQEIQDRQEKAKLEHLPEVLSAYQTADNEYKKLTDAGNPDAQRLAIAKGLSVVDEGARFGLFGGHSDDARKAIQSYDPVDSPNKITMMRNVIAKNKAGKSTVWVNDQTGARMIQDEQGNFARFDTHTNQYIPWEGDIKGFHPANPNQQPMEVKIDLAGKVAAEQVKGRDKAQTEVAQANKVGDDTKTGQAYIDTLPPAQQKITKAIVEGSTPLQSFSTRKYQGGKTDRDLQREHAMQADPSFTDNRYPMFQEFTKGQQGRNIVSMNTSIAHLGTLADATEAMKNGNVQVVNKIMNTVLTQMGEPQQPTLETARQAVGAELMRTFRGVGAGSKEEQEAWQRNWDNAKSPAQYAATLKEAGELLGGRALSLNEIWKSGTKLTTDFPGIVQPQSRAVLRRLGAKSDFVNLGAPRITTDAEFEALPSGTEFVDPKGVTRKKP